MASQEDYELCEAENANLREILTWATECLDADSRLKLDVKLKKPIEEGGVTKEDPTETEQMRAILEKLCDHITAGQEAISSDGDFSVWWAKLDVLAYEAREFERKKFRPTVTLHHLLKDPS